MFVATLYVYDVLYGSRHDYENSSVSIENALVVRNREVFCSTIFKLWAMFKGS